MEHTTTYLVVLLTYFIITLYIGWKSMQEMETHSDFFAAGHSLSPFVTFMGYLATGFSVASVMGGPAFSYTWGYSYMLYGPVTWTVAVIAAPFIASRLRKVTLVSPPEFFAKRYESKFLQGLAGLIILFGLIMGLSVQLNGVAKLLSIITGFPFHYGVIIAGLFTLSYTSMGGFKAASLTDVLQGAIFCFGVIIATVIIVSKAGGFSAINAKAALIDTVPFASEAATQPGTLTHPLALGAWSIPFLLANFLGYGLGTPVHPQYIMRLQGAKDVKSGLAMYYSYIPLAILWICLTVIGVAGRVLIPTLPVQFDSADWVFPLLIMEYIPPFVGALILAGAAAAACSTYDAMLLLCTSSVTYDMYKNFINPDMDEKNLKTASQIVSAVIGVISIIVTFYPPKFLLIMSSLVWGLFAATYFVPVVAGMYWKDATKEGGIASVIVGLVVVVYCQLKFGTAPIHPAAYAVPASLVAMVVVSKLTKPLPENTWKQYMS